MLIDFLFIQGLYSFQIAIPFLTLICILNRNVKLVDVYFKDYASAWKLEPIIDIKIISSMESCPNEYEDIIYYQLHGVSRRFSFDI